MATVFKKTFTKPLPPGSVIVEQNDKRIARWTDSRGKTRTAAVKMMTPTGDERIVLESATYTAKFRNGSGQIVEKATKCRDKSAAQARLNEFVRDAEMIRGGVITMQEAATADALQVLLSKHFKDYKAHLVAKGVSERHLDDQHRLLKRVADECSWTRLADAKRNDVERWLAAQSGEGMSARTRNTYTGALIAFGNWAVRAGKIGKNPFSGLPKANERADRRRERRALTIDELNALIAAAATRPLDNSLNNNRGENEAELKEQTRAYLSAKGHERALVYRTLAMTGLRYGELRSIRVVQVVLGAQPAHIILNATNEKARRGAQVPLRDDLANDIRRYVGEKLIVAQIAAERANEPIPLTLSPSTPLFELPLSLKKPFDADLKAAKIAKRDDRGRVLDVHSLRHTFATLLAKANVPLQQAQQLMRHSDPRLTASVYTHLTVLDGAAAVAKLPALAKDDENASQAKAMNDCTNNASPLAPMLAPDSVPTCANESQSDKINESDHDQTQRPRTAEKSNIDAGFRDVAARVTERKMVNGAGFEPAATGLKVGQAPFVSDATKEVAQADSAACTNACTKSEPNRLLKALNALRDLSPEERKAVIDLLTG